jgi:hypothetical protein
MPRTHPSMRAPMVRWYSYGRRVSREWSSCAASRHRLGGRSSRPSSGDACHSYGTSDTSRFRSVRTALIRRRSVARISPAPSRFATAITVAFTKTQGDVERLAHQHRCPHHVVRFHRLDDQSAARHGSHKRLLRLRADSRLQQVANFGQYGHWHANMTHLRGPPRGDAFVPRITAIDQRVQWPVSAMTISGADPSRTGRTLTRRYHSHRSPTARQWTAPATPPPGRRDTSRPPLVRATPYSPLFAARRAATGA